MLEVQIATDVPGKNDVLQQASVQKKNVNKRFIKKIHVCVSVFLCFFCFFFSCVSVHNPDSLKKTITHDNDLKLGQCIAQT